MYIIGSIQKAENTHTHTYTWLKEAPGVPLKVLHFPHEQFQFGHILEHLLEGLGLDGVHHLGHRQVCVPLGQVDGLAPVESTQLALLVAVTPNRYPNWHPQEHQEEEENRRTK